MNITRTEPDNNVAEMLAVFGIIAVLMYAAWLANIEYPRFKTSGSVPCIETAPLEYDLVERDYLFAGRPRTVSGIVDAYQRAGSPIVDKIPWVIATSEKYGLSPELVLAVMAEESGWGKSWACQNHFNCLGWGYLDSGDQGYHYSSFEEAFEDILRFYSVYYNVDTAEEMSALGYNTRQSWVDNVNLIMSYF